jgi:hypothetical protein
MPRAPNVEKNEKTDIVIAAEYSGRTLLPGTSVTIHLGSSIATPRPPIAQGRWARFPAIHREDLVKSFGFSRFLSHVLLRGSDNRRSSSRECWAISAGIFKQRRQIASPTGI